MSTGHRSLALASTLNSNSFARMAWSAASCPALVRQLVERTMVSAAADGAAPALISGSEEDQHLGAWRGGQQPGAPHVVLAALARSRAWPRLRKHMVALAYTKLLEQEEVRRHLR